MPLRGGSNKSLFEDDNTLLEIEYYQNFQNRSTKPIIEKRIVNLLENPKVSRPLFDNGRFKKLYREAIGIGKGGFGTVV